MGGQPASSQPDFPSLRRPAGSCEYDTASSSAFQLGTSGNRRLSQSRRRNVKAPAAFETELVALLVYNPRGGDSASPMNLTEASWQALLWQLYWDPKSTSPKTSRPTSSCWCAGSTSSPASPGSACSTSSTW